MEAASILNKAAWLHAIQVWTACLFFLHPDGTIESREIVAFIQVHKDHASLSLTWEAPSSSQARKRRGPWEFESPVGFWRTVAREGKILRLNFVRGFYKFRSPPDFSFPLFPWIISLCQSGDSYFVQDGLSG